MLFVDWGERDSGSEGITGRIELKNVCTHNDNIYL